MQTTNQNTDQQSTNSDAISGKLILLLGPSGSGKGTIINHIKKHYKQFIFPTSCTTRDPRPGEKPGDVYYYITKDEFTQRIENQEFLEWAIVHNDNYYGTLKSELLQPLTEGKTVLREVDFQGLLSIQKLIPKTNLHTVFIKTDSWNDLQSRIQRRAKIDPEELKARENSYYEELKHADECDYQITNRDNQLDTTLDQIDNVLKEITGV